MNWRTYFVVPASSEVPLKQFFATREPCAPGDNSKLLSAIPPHLQAPFIRAGFAKCVEVGLPSDVESQDFSDEIILLPGSVPVEIAILKKVNTDVYHFAQADTTRFPMPSLADVEAVANRIPVSVRYAAPELQPQWAKIGCAQITVETLSKPSRREHFVIRITSLRHPKDQRAKEILQRILGAVYLRGWRIDWAHSDIILGRPEVPNP